MGLDAATPLTQCLKHWAILTSPSGTNPSRRSNLHCLNQPRHSKPYLSAIRVNTALLRFDSGGTSVCGLNIGKGSKVHSKVRFRYSMLLLAITSGPSSKLKTSTDT
jgi:hypothetical protein